MNEWPEREKEIEEFVTSLSADPRYLDGLKKRPPRRRGNTVTTVAGHVLAYTVIIAVTVMVGLALYGAIRALARWVFLG